MAQNIIYERWLEFARENDEKMLEELSACNDAEISDRFYRSLSFGTGGLRGVIGAGTNRMNVYTVSKATAGLADYVLETADNKSVVIAYDSRNMSREFAECAASVLSSYGIRAYIFDKITPTPVLSYAVRELGAGAGIVITASHNPKEYNGYKVYNRAGCQITDEAAAAISSRISQHDDLAKYEAKASCIVWLGDEILDKYLETIKELSLYGKAGNSSVKIVYTPLHGTGNIPVRRILSDVGIENVTVVKEQELPDGNFETCPYPNPEERAALELAYQYAEKIDADMVVATDPDADRVGIVVKDAKSGTYRFLNGNETGLLLMEYMLNRKKELGILGSNPVIIKTIVTTDMAFSIAEEYGAKVKEVLTGFKYIGEAMDKTDNFVMGMEESYGYLVGKHARDKDAVSAVMMIAEMYAYYNGQGKGLVEVLDGLYEKYGYYLTDLVSLTYKGASGAEKMKAIISAIRENPRITIDGDEMEYTDFGLGVDGLPKSDVLRFRNNNVRILIRPSGTEPKLKIYYQIKSNCVESSQKKLADVKKAIEAILA